MFELYAVCAPLITHIVITQISFQNSVLCIFFRTICFDNKHVAQQWKSLLKGIYKYDFWYDD